MPAEAPSANLDAAESRSFQAETSKLLNIVASSLYSEREVFVRELISNASDALEKLRYIQATGKEISHPSVPLEISIATDSNNGLLVITDTGVGMSRDELVDNLGTIARSGSKAFMEKLDQDKTGGSTKEKIIGQFGVGFYSGFMVGDVLTVYSQSADPAFGPYMWRSQGLGEYTVAPAQGVTRGTRIEIKLRDDAKEYAEDSRIRDIVRKYSNFVGFPVKLNGETINTVQPLWTLAPSNVTQEQHDEFYRFISNGFDKPQYTLHYSTDAPLQLRSLLYVPSMNMEKFPGAGKTEHGVSLYCRKVLISNKVEKMFPAWMRFVRGVVDSEDIPLNLSRELLQDSALVSKIGNVLTSRLLKYFEKQMEEDREKFIKFFTDFQNFFVEGICTDAAHKAGLAKLLLMQSSKLEADKLTSLPEYKSRMVADQKHIYYIVASSREAALASPYMEIMKKRGEEVLLLLDPLMELAMMHLNEFEGTELTSVESSKVEGDDAQASNGSWSEEEATRFREWLRSSLGPDRVTDIKLSTRLTETPAVIVDHEPAVFRQMQRMRRGGMGMPTLPHTLSVNPEHPIIQRLHALASQDASESKALAERAAKQLFLNAQLAAGLVEDPKTLLPDLTALVAALVQVPP